MKKNSWHYSLAKIGNNNETIWDDEMSICQYSRKVIFGALLTMFAVTLLGIVVFWLGLALYEIIGAIFGFAALGPAAVVLLGAVLMIGFIAVCCKIKDVWSYKSRDLLKKDNNTFISSVYKSYKDKICFSVKFEE